jgi:hypothetical protein
VILDVLSQHARAKRLLKMYRLEFAHVLAVHFEEECAQPLASFNRSIETNILHIQILTALHKEIAFDGFAWLERWREETRTSSVIHQRKVKWLDQCNELFQAHDGQYKPWMRAIFSKLAVEFHARLQHLQLEQLFEWNRSLRYWNVMDRLIVFYDWHELVTRDTSYLFDVAERMTFIGRFERVVRNYFRHMREDEISEQVMLERFQNQYIVPRQFMRYDTWNREVDKLIRNERWMSRFSEATQLDLRFAALKSHTLLSFFRTAIDKRFDELQQQIEQRYGRTDRRWIELMTDIFDDVKFFLKRTARYDQQLYAALNEDKHENLEDRLTLIESVLNRVSIALDRQTLRGLVQEYLQISEVVKHDDYGALLHAVAGRSDRALYLSLVQRRIATHVEKNTDNGWKSLTLYYGNFLSDDHMLENFVLFYKPEDREAAVFRLIEHFLSRKTMFGFDQLSFFADLMDECADSSQQQASLLMRQLYEYVMDAIEALHEQNDSECIRWKKRFLPHLEKRNWWKLLKKHGDERMMWDWLTFTGEELERKFSQELKDPLVVARLQELEEFATRFPMSEERLAAVAKMRVACCELLGPHHPKVKGGI